MQKLDEALELMQKICDVNISMEDLDLLHNDVSEKQEIIKTISSAKCSAQLQRIKDIINKVESKHTLSKL